MSLARKILLVLSVTALLWVVLASFLVSIAHSDDASTTPTWRAAFISDYELRHGDTDPVVLDQLIAHVNAVCGDLTAGNNLAQVWQMGVDHGLSSDQSGTVIMLSTKYYCPQFDYLYTAPLPNEED